MDQSKLLREAEVGHLATVGYDQVRDRLGMMAENLHQKWEDSKADDVEGREQAWRMLKALKELERSFKTDIRDGELARKELEK